MSGSADDKRSGCEAVRELIAWYPSESLSTEERGRVEEHIEACASCRAELNFSARLKLDVDEGGVLHPEPDELVGFAEGRESLSVRERAAIQNHLRVCEECAHVVGTLRSIDRAPARVPIRAEAPSGFVERLRGLWEALTGSLLRPVPAAAYLTVAVAAVAVLLVRPAWISGPTSEHPSAGTGTEERTVLSGVVRLADHSGTRRGTQAEDAPGAAIDTKQVQFLLLEMTGLDAPPPPEASYRVQITAEGSREPAWEASVKGETFLENYTLCVLLDAGTLSPGRHILSVQDPTGNAVFESTLDAR